MSNGGYLKLWHKTLDSEVLKNQAAWQVFSFCLLSAMWRSHDHITKRELIKLEPGQFVTGRKIMAEKLRTSPDKIRAALKVLVEARNITIKTTNKYSIITVTNWAKYQGDGDETPSKIPNKPPTNHQQTTTEEEGKERKEYTDSFYAAYKARYGENPKPPTKAFVNLDRLIKSGVSLDQFQQRLKSYFAAKWPEAKDLQGLLTHWDKFAKPIEKERGLAL